MRPTFRTSSPTLVIFCFLVTVILMDVSWSLIVMLISISLRVRDIKYLFILFSYLYTFFEDMSIQVLCPKISKVNLIGMRSPGSQRDVSMDFSGAGHVKVIHLGHHILKIITAFCSGCWCFFSSFRSPGFTVVSDHSSCGVCVNIVLCSIHAHHRLSWETEK